MMDTNVIAETPAELKLIYLLCCTQYRLEE